MSVALAACFVITAVALGAEYRQPDGRVVELKKIESDGDSWFADEQGYSVVRVPGRYEYAILDAGGGLKASGIEIGSVDPRKSALPPRLTPSIEFLRKQRANAPRGLPPPNPQPIEVPLTNGVRVQLKLKGSGGYSWYEDENGYSIVNVSDQYEYALRGPSGTLVPCGILAGSVDPSEAGLKPGVRPNPKP